MTLRDPEVLNLLADDPELLALADAVAATQEAPRQPLLRRTSTRLVAVAAVAAVVVGVALVVPQGKHGIVDRAIAAIGDGRVMHVVVEMPTGSVDVDLQSGRRSVQQSRVELWADRQRQRFHVVMRMDGKVVSDDLWPQDAQAGDTLGPIDPAFAALWTGYREALEDGSATRAGEGEAFGHHVYWLRFEPGSAGEAGSEVAVDAETYKPVVYRVHNGALQTDEHILLAESIDFSAGDFTRDGPAPSLFSGSSTGGSTAAEDGVPPNTTVPSGWLTAGPEADGHRLSAVVPQTITPDHKRPIQGVQLVYGDLGHGLAAPGATTVDELPTPDDPDTWAHIPAGVVRIQDGQSSGPDGDHEMWTGYLAKDGRYVTITTRSGEDALLAIARSLRAVP
jgi:hypothetical protein